jgi:hypothetical protein
VERSRLRQPKMNRLAVIGGQPNPGYSIRWFSLLAINASCRSGSGRHAHPETVIIAELAKTRLPAVAP